MSLKKIFSVTIICLTFFTLNFYVPALADDANIINAENSKQRYVTPCWVNTSSIATTINRVNGICNWSVTTIGYSGTTKIKGYFILYYKNTNGTYSYLDTWEASSSSSLLYAQGSYSSAKSGTYKISYTLEIIKNGYTEYISNYFEKTV